MPEDKIAMIIQELVKRSNDSIRRLHELEGKMQAVDERTSSFENAGIEKTKSANDRFADMEARVRDMEARLIVLENALERLNKQVGRAARSTDVKELERMMDLLSPLRSPVKV